MSISRRSFLQFSVIPALAAAFPAAAQEPQKQKRILVYGDSNSFGYGYDPKLGIYRLPIEKVWPQVMAKEIGDGYSVTVNALSGRTICRDQADGSGTGKSMRGKDYNGMESLPGTLSGNFPLDLVIVMLGTNDSNSRHHTNGKQLADDLGKMAEFIRQAGWQSKTPYEAPKVLLIAPPVQPNDTAYGLAFNGAEKITRELASALQEKAKEIGVEFLNAQDYVKGDPGQSDHVHLDLDQHKALGEAAARKVKEILG